MPESEISTSDSLVIHVRPTTVDDVAGIEALIAPFVVHKRVLPRTTDELEELIPCGFVAVAGERIVGFAALEIYSKKLAEVRSLCVSREFQRHGIGRRLVEACVGRARERHVFEVMAITSTDDFFLSCGFDFTLPGEKKALFLQTRDEP